MTDGIANSLVAQMLYLDSDDSSKPIYLYINSPGGSVTAGLAIYDTMQYVKSDVVTICVGLAASMGAFLLAAGTKGKRLALPHSRIMIHQPLGGTSQRQASDIEIEAREILRIKDMLNKALAEMCDQPLEKVTKDTDRDYFLSAAGGEGVRPDRSGNRPPLGGLGQLSRAPRPRRAWIGRTSTVCVCPASRPEWPSSSTTPTPISAC